MFALVDCNNFYVSCERVFRPDLRNRPVVVLSNNDGCVVSRSAEAKELGIRMAAPAYRYQSLFREGAVHVFSSNYPLYGDMSTRVMQILSAFAPDIEVYSIDESFLHYTGCTDTDWDAHGREIRATVGRCTDIPVCIGFAPTKTLAKAANHIAKKFQQRTGGVYVIDTDEKRTKALNWLPVEDVWGIGYRSAKKLKAAGIHTAMQLALQPDEWVASLMSVTGLRLKYELQGRPAIEKEGEAPRKNIATTRSFENDYTGYGDIRERVVTFAGACAEKLRRQRMESRSLMVFLLTNRHRSDQAQYNPSTVVQLPFPTNSGIEIARYAVQGLQRIFREGYRYKKAGVVIMDFTPENGSQVNLFENSNPKHKPLMEVMDTINRRLGTQKVKLGGQDPGPGLKMRQEHLSPHYTTRWDEIMTVKV